MRHRAEHDSPLAGRANRARTVRFAGELAFCPIRRQALAAARGLSPEEVRAIIAAAATEHDEARRFMQELTD